MPNGDFNADIQWYFGGIPMARSASDLVTVAAPRPVLEAHVRRRIAARDNVTFLDEHDVEGLVTDPSRSRVLGARVRSRSGAESETELHADLVVDTTGRGSRTPRWLTEMGYRTPPEDRVKIGLAYTTRHYHLPEDPFDGDVAIIPVATPWSRRGGLFFPTPGDRRAMLSLTGVLGDHAPTDHEGFTAFARTLPVRRITEALEKAEPVDEPVKFSYPSSVWRRYDRLRDLPRGLLVLGDAVCSFNPVYGQGMSVAALESVALAEAIDRGTEQDRPRDYFRAIAKCIAAPWQTSAGADLGYPGAQGRRTIMTRVANAWVSRLQRSSPHDPELGAAFARVAGLVDPPPALLRPSVAWRLARTRAEPAPANSHPGPARSAA